MFVDELPTKKIGFLSPRHIIENQAYEFYHLAPKGVMLCMVSCGLDEFTVDDVERVFKPLDKYLDMLMQRDVSVIAQIGIPLPCVLGTKAHDALLKHIRDYTGVQATSQLHNAMDGMVHLKMKNILVVNKWTDQMNNNLKEFLAREGIKVCGVYNKSLTPAQFSVMSTNDSAALAYELASKGFKDHPEADGMMIGGGNWMSQPVSEQLEKEFGKPVVCNVNGMVWSFLNRVGMWKPIPNHGKLLGSGPSTRKYS
jgi:maleate cis-trans isomerase